MQTLLDLSLFSVQVSLPWSSLLHLLCQAQRHLPLLGSDSWSALAVACGKTTAWTVALNVLQVTRLKVAAFFVLACVGYISWDMWDDIC